MNKIVLASNNKHKISEIKTILKDYEIVPMSDVGFTEDIVEDGETFKDNALIKAKTISEYLNTLGTPYPVLADDSGLCVTALNLAPGVYSARFAGNHNDKANRDKLIMELQNHEDKSAYFECDLILYNPDGSYIHSIGRTHGNIINEERGDTSFGYDCIFKSNDLNKTFGEATHEEKNSVSHRGRALEDLVKKMSK